MGTDPGIDYGLGETNIDKETGIRFGVINMNAEGLSEWIWESMEADYGPPTCHSCGNEVTDYAATLEAIQATGIVESDLENYSKSSCADFLCSGCKLVLGSDEVYADEPNGHSFIEDGYNGFVDSHNDLWIFRSPYYTHARYCSPCAPGAGHLENPCPDGPRTYCLGHDFFKDNKAPYLVYEVATGNLVK